MLLTSVLLSLLISAILLVSHWSENKGIVYLIVVIILFSIRQFIFILIHSDAHVEVLALLIFHLDPLFFLLGPFFLYYLKSIVHGKLVTDKYLLIYMIPALIAGINTLPYYSYPFAEKVAESAAIQGNYFLDGSVNFKLLFFPFKYQLRFAALYNLSVVLASFVYLIRLKKNSAIPLKKKVSVLLNRILAVTTLVVIIPNLMVLLYVLVNSPKKGELVFRQAAFEDNGAIFFMTLLLPLSFFLVPSWLYNNQASATTLEKIRGFLQRIWLSTSKTALESKIEKSADLERIIAYLETEKPYVNVSFTLHDISQALNIPHVRVTTCFNKELNTSFPSYRNKLRLAHAISLLRAGTHLTISIEGIAERSGFKSKSIFYAAFKEEYGMPPTDWMKKNLLVVKEAPIEHQMI
jgi:AraC-like DNA-binding protein